MLEHKRMAALNLTEKDLDMLLGENAPYEHRFKILGLKVSEAMPVETAKAKLAEAKRQTRALGLLDIKSIGTLLLAANGVKCVQ